MHPAIARRRRQLAAEGQPERNVHRWRQQLEINVGEAERWASMAGGTLLVTCGLLRGSLSGIALALLGAGLIYRGHSGHCSVYQALGQSSADQPA